ncbi:Hypothetical predicted protein [Mytilus galloprovincialis]|uniref:Uncharacterized protein n=1 Tax=Mytilus galloprovincialis TaxID=29158 RepID=A0A8B6BYM2_MYTGA|nr:Hypothetical predicted protein [Mytilus galloprovincialis]
MSLQIARLAGLRMVRNGVRNIAGSATAGAAGAAGASFLAANVASTCLSSTAGVVYISDKFKVRNDPIFMKTDIKV